MSEASDSYEKGTRAWFQDKEEGWVSAELVEKQVTDKLVTLIFVDTLGREQRYEAAIGDVKESPGGAGAGFDSTVLPPLRNPPLLEQTEDLTNLSYLNEPSVLHAIRNRYAVQQIYTYSGIVLVAVNPFQSIPLYSSSYVQMYAGRRKGELEPHLFAIAEDAYRCMTQDQRDQTIIVSGESGAGKTVSAKYIMRYFATVDDPGRPGKRKASKDGSGMSETEQQILATNPIMEAFGNAKTTRNDNSSRFGKFTEILFDKSQTIVGARIRTYLLERSRLVYQPATERNYHIFYQLLAGAPASDRGSLGLDDVSTFHFLNQGGPGAKTIDGVDDAKEFAATQKALSTVGITSEQQWQVFGLLASLLHLGNISITQTRTDAAIAETDAALNMAAKLLGIDASEFRKWIVKKQLVTRSEKIVTALSATQATVVRDSVAKFVYACLFDWLVAVINESLASDVTHVNRFIGVLDIYGFEFFEKNSFEQFCINYANEKLQQEFNAHVFKLEQEEYVAEKINWTFIDYSDNQPCIDLIEGKLGILSLLDEESRLPSGSDPSFTQKLYSTLTKSEHAAVFKKPRFGTSAFTIAHYALDVTYESEGFLEKNRDTVPDEQLSLLSSTSNVFLKEVIERSLAVQNAAREAKAKEPEATSAASKRMSAIPAGMASTTMNRRSGASGGASTARKPTLGSIFKTSLISLMDTIDATNAHYIRCIKPNDSKAAWAFQPQMVLGQLRACGVLETIRISCAGYPTRWTYEEFAERYYMLTSSKNWGPEIEQLCGLILSATIKEADRYQAGETKIFFRAGMLAQLEKQRTDRLNALATLIQKNLRRHVHAKRYRNLRATIVGIQTAWRRVRAQRAAEEARRQKAALDIQRVARGHIERVRYLRTRRAIVSLQSAARGQKARRQVRETRTTNAATLLQALFRGLLARRSHSRDLQRVVLLQSCIRRRQARNEFKTLKAEAKSVSHFKEVSYKLENKVVELTQTLQKRTTDNRALAAKLAALESSLASWQNKYEESEGKSKALLAQVEKPTVALPEFEALETQKKELEGKLSQSMKRMQDQETQIQRLTEDFDRQTAEMEKRQKLLDEIKSNGPSEDMTTVSALRSELSTLREQLSRTVAQQNAIRPAPRGDGSFQLGTGRAVNGVENGHTGTTGPFATPAKRRNRRQSINGYPSDPIPDLPDDFESALEPRAASMLPGAEGNFRAPGSTAYISNGNDEDPTEEIMRLLENEEALDEDVLVGLIQTLKLPAPSNNNPPMQKDVLFPAHLISLVTNEMWKYGYMRESERFLANVMQTIQHLVMAQQGEEAIMPGIFWLSNVHEILSFVCIAESDILQGIGPGVDGSGRDFDWEDYERLVTIVKHDLDSLEYNIYHTFMQEAKKKLHKMIVPALIESQSLPGFVTTEGSGRLFNRLLAGNTTPAHTMDEVLNLLNRVWKCMQSYYVEHTVIQQVVTELLKLIGVTSFNDLLMRRNFCSWKRGIQVQYNVTRLIEWCKSHDIPEGALQLEHIMQATKLLQLKKASKHDVDIIWDVCWVLTPTQIQKLITAYHVNDFENPIGPEILKEIASRVNANEKGDHLLLPPEIDEAGPFDVPLPREVQGLETYIPTQLLVPTIRRLAGLVA